MDLTLFNTMVENLILNANLLILNKLNLYSNLVLLGIILVIQFLHYPVYYFIDHQKFSRYQKFHTTTITPIVGSFMLVEIISVAILFLKNINSLFYLFNLTCVLIIWFSTVFFSIPQHNKLSLGYDKIAIKKLISTNWIRTLVWFFKLIVLLILDFRQ